MSKRKIRRRLATPLVGRGRVEAAEEEMNGVGWGAAGFRQKLRLFFVKQRTAGVLEKRRGGFFEFARSFSNLIG